MPSNANDVADKVGKFGENIENDIVLKLERAGEYLANKMSEKVYSNIPPALKEATVKAKGSSHTLIDTGEMAENITHKMKDKTTVEVGVFRWI